MKRTPTIETGLGTLIITGSSGLIGSSFIDRIGGSYTEMGLDREGPPHPPPETDHVIGCDLSSDESVWTALDEVRRLGHRRITSVIHLAAYPGDDPMDRCEAFQVAVVQANQTRQRIENGQSAVFEQLGGPFRHRSPR